ncbi:MAG: type V CRISPR-associated protein Cas12b, partial [Nitrospiraceae bacterium]|nr:type V CRISPR-associated protein Cas12b [Nitrospiraceae bacterium]
MADKLPVTQRAYTLRLRGTDKNDSTWQEKLWKTHETVNKGAKAFGDWLLTMRGGLSHDLVDLKVKNEDEKTGRRILLALSWLSVESKAGAPEKYIVPPTVDTKTGKVYWKTKDALCSILRLRGLNETDIENWVEDCMASLSAAIRDDAVWVNRSNAFDEFCNGQDMLGARKDAQILLWFLLSDDYLVLPKKAKKEKKKELAGAEGEEEPSEDEIEEQKLNAAIQSGKGAGQRTRHPFSHIFGFKEDSQGFGKGKQKLDLKDYWKQQLKPCINESGIPLLETKQKKNNGASPTELHREMFSKAASRLAQIHTKQKQQEVEREQRKTADEELKKLESETAYKYALSKLREYCERYEESSGSLRGFQIQPRQISKWEVVVETWAKIAETDVTKAEEKRIEEAKRLQEEMRDEKFGDINLFIRLSEEEYKPVWWHNNKADASILKTFVRGMRARADAEFLKVAAYRHPDPYFNPVFCQFGVSRPAIEFSRLDPLPSKDKDVRTVKMLTWDGQMADRFQYLAISKRFDSEIGSICESAHKNLARPLVSRRDRLNLSAISCDKGNVCIAHVFDQKKVRQRGKDDQAENTKTTKEKEPEWNGTLQAERRELERIGKQTDKVKAESLRKNLKWWLIISMELQPQGPWVDYINNSVDKLPFERTYQSGEKKGQKYVSLTGWPLETENKNREGMAKLILSRLPGLRVLSVDLGHRYAAACAVWETLSCKKFEEECKKAKGEGAEVIVKDLYAKIQYSEKESNANTKKACQEKRIKKFKPTTFYRRVGPNTLNDNKPHPAPWARLDRQFLIKLQGEEKPARMATADEIWQVHEIERKLGRSKPLIDRLIKAGWGNDPKFPYQRQLLEELKGRGWVPINAPADNEDDEGTYRRQSLSVDDLMSSAVDTLRLALRRHGDRARIASGLKTDYKPMPGDQKCCFILQKGDSEDKKRERREKHVDYLQDILLLWHDLAFGKKWKDDWSKKAWEEHIETLVGYSAPEEVAADLTGSQRKKKRQLNKNKLKAVAEGLVGNKSLRIKLHTYWATKWREEDGNCAETEHRISIMDNKKISRDEILSEAKGWYKRIRWLKCWVTGHQKEMNIRHVGGLSLTRIATIKSLYQVQKAFYTRLTPSCRQTEEGKLITAGEGFDQSILDVMENMREQRVKQLASRIVEAALGVGRMKMPGKGKDQKRPIERVDEPCHAVVIENLTHYRPEETRTRRENRQLMTWSSSKVKKYLFEGCQLHGLHLREVPAGYTSRQDSRTGAPGLRCEDVPVKDFLESPFWKKEFERAEQKHKEKKGDAIDKYLLDLKRRWAKGSASNFSIRIPRKGGEIFVSSDKNS